MTKEERELRREQREHMKRMEAAAKEAGRGPIDVPFLLLVLPLCHLWPQRHCLPLSGSP